MQNSLNRLLQSKSATLFQTRRQLFASKIVTMATPSTAPTAIGPYSIGKMVKQENGGGTWGFSSGALGMCATTGELVSDEAAPQSDRALQNLQAVAEANGFTLGDAVKCTVFLVDMGDFADVNKVYARYFTGDEPPARSCVAVHQLPKGAKFEIEAIFFKG